MAQTGYLTEFLLDLFRNISDTKHCGNRVWNFPCFFQRFL